MSTHYVCFVHVCSWSNWKFPPVSGNKLKKHVSKSQTNYLNQQKKPYIVLSMLSNFLLVFVVFSLSQGNNVKENLQEKNELGAECRDSSTSGRDVSSCPSLKALDFSVDNDGKADQGGEFTHASLAKE